MDLPSTCTGSGLLQQSPGHPAAAGPFQSQKDVNKQAVTGTIPPFWWIWFWLARRRAPPCWALPASSLFIFSLWCGTHPPRPAEHRQHLCVLSLLILASVINKKVAFSLSCASPAPPPRPPLSFPLLRLKRETGRPAAVRRNREWRQPGGHT